MRTRIIHAISIIAAIVCNLAAQAQQPVTISLEEAINRALENNHFLKIREYQIEDKESKVRESRIKALPTVITSSTWQYNQNIGHLTIDEGSLGSFPLTPQIVIPLPFEDLSFELSERKSFNAGVTLYQPVTQLAKIKAGVEVSKTELQLAEKEKEKSAAQIRQAVEKLYYGLLINQKQQEEAIAKTELAGIKLHDVESALQSGKTLEASRAGLLANIADEEQNLLKLEFQAEDWLADFRTITGLDSEQIILEPVDEAPEPELPRDDHLLPAEMNNDLEMALLSQTKAEKAINAAQRSYLPDLGLVAGYAYQTGNKIYPEHNPFVGINFKWNLYDVYANRQLVSQRKSQFLQAQEQVELTRKQVSSEIEKTMRKLNHAKALIAVARKAVQYRREELKIQEEKQKNGLNTPVDVLTAKTSLAKSEADLLAAELNCRLVYTDLQTLLGKMIQN